MGKRAALLRQVAKVAIIKDVRGDTVGKKEALEEYSAFGNKVFSIINSGLM